jgi:hypothetical protein
MAPDDMNRNVARQELEAFFRRSAERENFYSAECLAEQLTQRGTRSVLCAAWLAALEEALRRPGLLQVRPDGPCCVCPLEQTDSARSYPGCALVLRPHPH